MAVRSVDQRSKKKCGISNGVWMFKLSIFKVVFKKKALVSVLLLFKFIQSAIRGFNGDYLFSSRISTRYVFVFRSIMTRSS